MVELKGKRRRLVEKLLFKVTLSGNLVKKRKLLDRFIVESAVANKKRRVNKI
jgi:hypothetical protein